MTISYSPTVLNAMLEAYESSIGTSPSLLFYTGAAPAITAAATGTLLATLALPSDWMANASGASKAKTGTWTGTAAAAGTAGYYRIAASGGTVMEQGSITATGSGGDLTLDNPSIAANQTITISGWTKNLAAA